MFFVTYPRHQDDEVDRLERASHAASGTATRQEVMESMYGRADPRPQGVGARGGV